MSPLPGKATARAPANIALIKYWGAEDVDEGLPLNRSLSMTLTRCVSLCTVEAHPEEGEDEVFRADPRRGLEPADPPFAAPVLRHLERLRRWADRRARFRVATRTGFPVGAGLASSASGFAALTLAAVRALGRDPESDELSVLARRSGSGSAARSCFGGYVEWPGGGGDGVDPGAPARPVFPRDHWDLRDVIALVDRSPKKVSSREGHRRAGTSPHFATRLARLPERLGAVRRALEERDFGALAPMVEAESVELHMIAMTSRPPIFYWSGGSVEVMEAVRTLREEGIRACFTMDAGPNVHVLCPAGDEEAVADRLSALDAVDGVIRDRVGSGPSLVPDHLF
ncbi:MAG TPA: diphosphomevalonate decarboxylase [Longimicrobiales bacterium]|nr:diphosphomevalonate decarboxylase [Longimicrobiales bacterium]